MFKAILVILIIKLKKICLLKYISDFKAFIVFSIIMFVGVYFIGQKLGIGISVLLAQIVIGAFIYGILCMRILWKTLLCSFLLES